MSQEEIEKCMKDIDTDGSGQVSFDEFAIWFIGGREGTPAGVGGKVSNLLSSSSAYNAIIMDKLNHAMQELLELQKKDTRTLSCSFATSKFDQNPD